MYPPSLSNSFIHSYQYICVSGQQIFTKFRGDFLLWELWNPDFLNTSSENYKSLEGDLLQEVCIQLCLASVDALNKITVSQVR